MVPHGRAVVVLPAEEECTPSGRCHLAGAGVETLYDDRDERGGAKLASMDLIGLPWQLIVGPRGIATGTVELKKRSTGEKLELSVESALARLVGA